MKKRFLVLFLCSNFFFLIAQEKITINVENALYRVNEPTISFDFSVTNISSETIYFLEPHAFLFDKHLDLNNQLEGHGLDRAPYKLDIITEETKALNRILYYSASDYRSKEKDNFEKLNSFFNELKSMKALNGKTFTSNKIIATELK